MQVKVQPRLQLETWSMYWKQPSKTDTRCLDTITLKVDDAGVDTKVSTMMDQVHAACTSSAVAQLARSCTSLDGTCFPTSAEAGRSRTTYPAVTAATLSTVEL
eukprot:GHUV01028398.1.p2 GENE.GHUV01028398.1~~GHUV01028398.1.p2  ORF type:complete len:103 (+),score=25.70 GHUV01028398.1:259-567(+)